MPDCLALFASARREGNTGRLMDRVARELGIEVVDLAQLRMAAYTYEHANRDDDFEPLMQRVLACQRVIFASPVYWYSVSPPMKVFLDRISDYLELPELLDQGRQLRGKTGWVLCTSVMDAPAAEFIGLFRQTFEYLGMRFGGQLHANCANGYQPETYEADAREFVRLLKA